MTNEEARSNLEKLLQLYDDGMIDFSIIRESIKLAIEALKEQQEHSQNTSSKQPDLNMLGIKTGETCADVISRQDAIDAVKKHYRVDNDLLELIAYEIEQLPSANSKQLQILANVLDGCPLTQPCDKMWRGGWCEEHCKNNKLQEPNAECWLKYAEVMAADDT